MTWDFVDYAVFAAMLAGLIIIYRLMMRKTNNRAYRLGAGVALAAAFLLIWFNGAVGIIGDEHNDANVMYVGLLAVAVVGSIIARFQARGMARTLFVTALVQALIGTIAFIAGMGSTSPIWPMDIVFLSGFFVALWLLSAYLFRSAARQKSATDTAA